MNKNMVGSKKAAAAAFALTIPNATIRGTTANAVTYAGKGSETHQIPVSNRMNMHVVA